MRDDRFHAGLLHDPGPRAPVRVPRVGFRINWGMVAGLTLCGVFWFLIGRASGRFLVEVALQVAAWVASVTLR